MSRLRPGLHVGVVTDNDDPQRRSRVRVRVPHLSDGDVGWCSPCLPAAGGGSGFALVPAVGATVLVQWLHGDLGAPPVWMGASWDGSDPVPGSGPGAVVLVTPGGHRVELSDDDGAVVLTCSSGPVVRLDGDGVRVENGAGAALVLKGSEVEVNGGALVVR